MSRDYKPPYKVS